MIPFVGGMSFIGGMTSYMQSAWVGLAGPIGGSLLAIISYAIYSVTGIPFFMASIYWILLLNLINLVPISSLDGGRVMNAIVYSINEKVGLYTEVISTVVFTFLFCYLHLFFIAAFIGFFGFRSAGLEYLNQKSSASDQTKALPRELKKMTTKQMVFTSAVWAIIVIILGGICLLLKDNPTSSLQFLINNRK